MDYLLVPCQKLKKKNELLGLGRVTTANKYLFSVIRHRAIKLLIQVSFSFSDRQYKSPALRVDLEVSSGGTM